MNTKDIFDKVWVEQGFFLLDVGVVDSKTLRKNMFDIKEKLNEFIQLGFFSMSRFDQQETTPYHQDGGPESNILMLGYESSNVQSQLFIQNEFEETELSLIPKDHSFILIINNSKKGVFHKAIIKKNKEEKRVINSIMLIVGKDMVSVKEQQDFLNTDKIY